MNYKSSMTDVGNEMIAQAHKDDKAIIFDSFLVSEALSDTGVELTKTTKNLFSNPLTYPINSKATSDNTFTVKAVLANKTDKFTVDEDFSINVIGVIAHIDGSSDSRLITIAVAEGTGAVITAFRDTLYSLTVAITQAYKADQPANFGLANVAYALADDLDKLKTDIQIIIDGGLTNVAKINEENTFTEVQKFDKGATDGKGNAYATTKDVATGLNNGLSTKVNVSDMRKPASDVAGIEEVNAKQDKIGYTPADDSKVAHLSGANDFDTVPTVNNNQLLLENYYTVDLTDSKYDRNKWYYVEANSQQLGFLRGPSYFTLEAPLFNGINVPYGSHSATGTNKDACARQTVLYSEAGWGAYNRKLTVIEDQTSLTTDGKRLLTFAVLSDTNLNYAFYARGGLKVNITSDVPGLTWTPHTDTFVENEATISVLNDAPDPKALGLDDNHTFWALPMSQFNQQLKSYVTAVTQLNSTDMNTVRTAGFYQLNSGTNGMPNADAYSIYQVITLSSFNGVQLAYGTNSAILGMRSWSGGSTFTSWVQFADDSKVVHSTDMRKPASDVAGIEEVNAKQDKLEYTPANAANVVHRNPDTGVVSEPVDFTKLTVNGGKSVATSDDLKSLEDASWHTITGKSDSLSAYTCMYRKNNEQKYVDLVLYGTMGIAKNDYLNIPDTQTELLDLKDIVNAPKGIRGMIVCASQNPSGGGATYDLEISGTKLTFAWSDNNVLPKGKRIVSANDDDGSVFMRVTFD